LVTFNGDSAIVKLYISPTQQEERLVKTGLSDAINIEIVSGLKEGDEVMEKPVKKIE
jgi:HlyD family secretion protein